MKPTWLERLLAWLGVERHDIGRHGLDRYLTRYVLFGRKGPDGTRRYGAGQKVFLHCFYRGDAEPYPHCHPWPFWSLILWGGYYEVILRPDGTEQRRWYGPLRLLRRPAEWRHRVELPEGRRCWTLLWIGRKVRSWGFWTSCGFIPWREHQKKQEAGLPICDEE